jgi:toxin-antitoxin system PIN domain toxin
MIVPDVNLLVYAYNKDAPHHRAARQWWEDTLSGTESIGLAWVTCLGYLRLTTNRRVLLHPWNAGEVIDHIRAWLARPHVQLLQPGPRHLDILAEFATAGALASELTTDAHLAALAIEYQGTVCSNDSDFTRFPGLRHQNPLRV